MRANQRRSSRLWSCAEWWTEPPQNGRIQAARQSLVQHLLNPIVTLMAHNINNSGGTRLARLGPSSKGTAVMPFDTSSRLLGRSLAEKVAILSKFILNDLESRTERGMHVTGGCYLLVARSPDSPVAQALRAQASRLASTGVRVRAIFSEAAPGRAAAAMQAAPFALPSECRLTRDTRLLAAHEQLVLAPDCAWIGDCMRREPSKRDTYERFAVSCSETAVLATRSFERLWRIAVPVETMPSLAAALASRRLPEFGGTVPARPEDPRRQ